MIHFIHDTDEHPAMIRQYVALGNDHHPDHFFGQWSVGIGILNERQLLGGCVYSNWQERSETIEFSGFATSPKWLTRQSLRHLFAFPFAECGARILWARTGENNVRTRSILRRLGFEETKIPWLYADEEAECVMVMHRRKWATNMLFGPVASCSTVDLESAAA